MVLKPKANELLEIITKARNKTLAVSELNEFLVSYRNLYKEVKPTGATSNYIFSLSEVIK